MRGGLIKKMAIKQKSLYTGIYDVFLKYQERQESYLTEKKAEDLLCAHTELGPLPVGCDLEEILGRLEDWRLIARDKKARRFLVLQKD